MNLLVTYPPSLLQDDLAIYDRALTAGQAQWLYEEGDLLYNGGWEAPNIGTNPYITQVMGSEPAGLAWTLTQGTLDSVRSVWLPYAGYQSIDSAGSSMGYFKQVLSGLGVGSSYTFSTMMSGNFGVAGARGLRVLLNGVVTARWTMDPPAGWSMLTYMGYQRKEFTFLATATTATLELQTLYDFTYAGAALDATRVELVVPTPLPSAAPFACPFGGLATFSNITDAPTVTTDGRVVDYAAPGVDARLVPTTARYVRFWKTPSDYDANSIDINLAEVAVYAAGDMATNVALNKAVTTSSVLNHPCFAPSLLTDGVVNSADGYSLGIHTADATPWAEIDLQQDVPIALILVYPRIDCCYFRTWNINLQLLADGSRAVVAAYKFPTGFPLTPARGVFQAQVCASPTPAATPSTSASPSASASPSRTGTVTATGSVSPSQSGEFAAAGWVVCGDGWRAGVAGRARAACCSHLTPPAASGGVARRWGKGACQQE